MTINIELNDLTNLNNTTAVTQINQNSEAIEGGFTTALNVTGDQMQGTLDMNSNQIINLPTPATANSPARLQDLSTLASGGTVSNIPSGGASGNVLVKSGTTPFTSTWGAVSISGATYTAGTGLTLSASAFSITNTAVASGSYGAAASVPVLTINAQGQITSATTVAAAGGGSAASGTYGSAGTVPQIVITSTGGVSSITNISIGIAGSQVTSGTISGSVMSSISLGAGNVNGGVTGLLPFTNMVGSDIATVGTITTGTWSATAITATSLSGTTLAGNIVASSLTSLGTISSFSSQVITVNSTITSTPIVILSEATTAVTSFIAGTNFALISGSAAFNTVNMGFGVGGVYTFYRAQGTIASPTTLANTINVGSFSWSGYNGSGIASNVATMNAVATDITGWTATSNGLSLQFNATPSGTTARAQSMRIGGGVFVGTATTDPGSGNIQVGNAFIMPQYTVTTLPSGVTGMVVMVTDASASTFLSALTGGGTTKTLALYSGATWLDI